MHCGDGDSYGSEKGVANEMTAHETEQLFLEQRNTAIVQYTTFAVLNVSNTLSPNQPEIVRDGTSGDGGRQSTKATSRHWTLPRYPGRDIIKPLFCEVTEAFDLPN